MTIGQGPEARPRMVLSELWVGPVARQLVALGLLGGSSGVVRDLKCRGCLNAAGSLEQWLRGCVNLRSAYPAIVHTTRASLYVIHSQLKLCVLGSSHNQPNLSPTAPPLQTTLLQHGFRPTFLLLAQRMKCLWS